MCAGMNWVYSRDILTVSASIWVELNTLAVGGLVKLWVHMGESIAVNMFNLEPIFKKFIRYRLGVCKTSTTAQHLEACTKKAMLVMNVNFMS